MSERKGHRTEVADWPPSADAGQAPDREMRCVECSYRCFTSAAPVLVARGRHCPRCQMPLSLAPPLKQLPAPDLREFRYPTVHETGARRA
jgi:hypothetical protein